MADHTAYLDLKRHRDLKGRGAEPWARRVVLALLAVFVGAGLSGAFGQRTTAHADDGPAAQLRVVGPATLRGGLLWPARIEVRALRDIERPRLVLAPGWIRGMQINTIEPAPAGEESQDARLELSYDRLATGDRLVVYLQAQVNPTTIGRQDTSVALQDEATELAHVVRSTTVLP